MLMPLSASALKAVAATPAWLRMPMPMTETLRHAGFAPGSTSIADRRLAAASSTASALSKSPRRHGEGDVGDRAVLGDVLDDHVDIDVGLGQRPEDRRRRRPACPRRGAAMIWASSLA